MLDGEPDASRYSLAFTVEGYLEQGAGADAHAALNDFYAATVAALITEPRLGGLVETIGEAIGAVERGNNRITGNNRLWSCTEAVFKTGKVPAECAAKPR